GLPRLPANQFPRHPIAFKSAMQPFRQVSIFVTVTDEGAEFADHWPLCRTHGNTLPTPQAIQIWADPPLFSHKSAAGAIGSWRTSWMHDSSPPRRPRQSRGITRGPVCQGPT